MCHKKLRQKNFDAANMKIFCWQILYPEQFQIVNYVHILDIQNKDNDNGLSYSCNTDRNLHLSYDMVASIQMKRLRHIDMMYFRIYAHRILNTFLLMMNETKNVKKMLMMKNRCHSLYYCISPFRLVQQRL